MENEEVVVQNCFPLFDFIAKC